VQGGELLPQLPEVGAQLRHGRLGEHALGEGQFLARTQKSAIQEVVLAIGLKQAPDRAARQPVEITGDLAADAVARQELDQAQAVQPQQALQAFRRGQTIGGDHLRDGPMIEGADGDEQQMPIGDQFLFLALRQRAQARSAGLGLVGQLRHRVAEEPGDFRQAVEGEAAGLVISIGSAYYRCGPDDARIAWDRLPIAVACAGLPGAVWAETRPEGRDHTVWLALLAIASVAWSVHSGDLRLYVLAQGLPLLLAPLMQTIHRAPRCDRAAFGIAFLLYGLAKVAELYDHQLFALLGVLSGHTIKHLLAAAAGAVLVGRLVERVREPASAPSAIDSLQPGQAAN
jgi:hypothetical protein